MPDQNSDFVSTWKNHAFKRVSTSSAPTESETSVVSEQPVGTGPAVPAATVAKPAPSGVKTPSQKSVRPWWKSRKVWLAVGIPLLILLIVASSVGALGWWTYTKVQDIKMHAQAAEFEARIVYDEFKAQHLTEAKSHLLLVEEHRAAAAATYNELSFYGKVPFVKRYYEDGSAGFAAGEAGIRAGIKFFEAIEPHADLLGFNAESEAYFGTTEDRIGMVLVTLSQIAPQLDGIADEIDIVKQNLDTIDPADYPVDLQGYPVRSYVEQAKAGADAAEVALNEARPALERLPAVAGAEGKRKYLVIFQNDNELRATGGFMTAYSVITVENGKITPEKSGDIYDLDLKFRNKPPIPEILGRFLTSETRWNLRDMNIDPNFENSMKIFAEYYAQIPGESKDLDGIIAVDTEMLQKIVDVTGPVDVPGYGTFSTKILPVCDCSQIIYVLSEIIDRPTPYLRENRKGILAPMMQAIIQKVYDTPKDTWPELAQLGWDGIQGRHVQMYFFNEEDQNGARAVNAAGDLPNMPSEGDYLTIIDSNLGGAKSNLFIETEMEVKVTDAENGIARKEVEMTYRNTHPPSNCDLEAGELCLNGLLNDWSRWYVPKGAVVESSLGFTDGHTIDTSNPDFDIIEGSFLVQPEGQAKVRITYTVPYTLTDRYQLLVQKQGGLDKIGANIITPWGSEEVDLTQDRTFRFTW